MILADEEVIDLPHFPELELSSPVPAVAATRSLSTGLTLSELERRYIVATLARMGGNRTRTAKALGISVRGLQYKLRAHGRDDHDAGESDAAVRRRA